MPAGLEYEGHLAGLNVTQLPTIKVLVLIVTLTSCIGNWVEPSTLDSACLHAARTEGTSLSADMLPYVEFPSRLVSNYTLNVEYSTFEVIENPICALKLIFSNEHGENMVKVLVYEHVYFVGEANPPLESWICSDYSSESTVIGFHAACAAILHYRDTQVNILVYSQGNSQETRVWANSITLVNRTAYEQP